MFYTLADIPKSQRSQVDRLHLVMVFREKLLKKYSLQTIYKRLVKDLMTLEAGIIINFPMSRRVRCGVLCYAADNLEASTVGGFSACFSSKDVCRTCHIQHQELETHITDFDSASPHTYWTELEYDQIVQSLDNEEDEIEDTFLVEDDRICSESEIELSDSADSDTDADMSEGEEVIINKRGLNSKCPLNVLQSFHRDELNCICSTRMLGCAFSVERLFLGGRQRGVKFVWSNTRKSFGY